MIKQILATAVLASLLSSTSAYADFTYGADFNSMNMSYTANSTVGQTVVFDSTLQSSTSVTFTVQARNGGGRPTVAPDGYTAPSTLYATNTDKATLTLNFYDSSGTLIGSKVGTQQELHNYGTADNTGWSTGPGDNIYDWENMTLTATTSDVDFTQVAHVEVEMKGTDGSYWAGNYGVQWRAPTLVSDTSSDNLLYNPEFGLASDGTTAQGWSANLGYANGCGVVSGSQHCVTNGGATANQTNGTEDANGGTVNGTAGGYPSTFTISTFSGSSGDGTVTDTSSSGGSSAPTVTGTAAGTPTVTTSTSAGTTVVTTSTSRGTATVVTDVANVVSETTTQQTVDQTTTVTTTTPVTTVTTNTTPVTTTTCTTPTTVTTYSDGSTTSADGTQTCSDSTTNTVTTSSATVDDVVVDVSTQAFTGSIDQLATAQDITSSIVRSVEFNGIQALGFRHNYDNGMSGSSTGFTLGGTKTADNGIIIGGGLAQFSTSVNDANSNSASASTTMLDANIGKPVEQGTVTVGVRHAMSDYTMGRTISPWANTGATSGTDTSARIMFEGSGEKVKPVIGYTRGQRSTDAYVEGGDALTARSVAESSEMYGYGTIGLRGDLGLVDFTAMHHTDGVNDIALGLEKQTDKVTWRVEAKHSTTPLGSTNSVTAGINIKF